MAIEKLKVKNSKIKLGSIHTFKTIKLTMNSDRHNAEIWNTYLNSEHH